MQLVLNILISAAAVALVSTGVNIVMLATRRIPVMLATTMTAVAYVYYGLSRSGCALWLGFGFALITGVTFGLLLDAFERLALVRREQGAAWLSIVFGLGLFVVVQSMTSLLWGEAGKTFLLERLVYDVWSARMTNVHLIIIGCAMLTLTTAVRLLNGTPWGLHLRALRSNPSLCEIMGVPIFRSRANGIALGTLLAGMGVQLFVLDVGLVPSSGFSLFLAGLTAAIIGGGGTVGGAIAGAILIATVRNLTAYGLGIAWMETSTYMILIIMLILRPLGLKGGSLKKVEV